jgi:hypothetical protein
MHRLPVTYEWTIYVPTRAQSGKPFAAVDHKRWEQRVTEMTGGMTFHGRVQGLHLAPANKEESMDVSIVCTAAQIRQIAKFTKQHYRQQAILVIRGAPAFIL